MSKVMRGLAPMFLAASSLVIAGCSADNESDANRLQNAAGAAPTSTVKGGEAPPQPSTYQQYAERQKQERSQDPRKSDYAKSVGGAKK